MKLVIGLVGEKGSGKQTFVNFLRQIVEEGNRHKAVGNTPADTNASGLQPKAYTIRQVRFSDILAQTLLIWDIPNTRENFQKLSIAMNQTFGAETLAHAAEFNIETDSADIIILDGPRRQSEIDIIRNQKPNLLVYVTADQKLRYERLKNRSEKVGETGLSYEQFMKEENIETETLIPKLGTKADVKIENNGNLEEFKAKIEDFFKKSVLS